MKDIEIDYKKLYEEEHEKYEGALERAKGHHSVASHYNNADEIQELEHIFPELKEKESEDEKVRKSIIKLLQVGGYMSPEDKDKAFAWLKEQGHDGKKWIYEDVYLKEKEQLFQDGIDEVLENPQKYGLEKQDEQKKKHNEIYETIKEKSYKEGVEDGILTGTKIQESTDNIIEEEKSLLEKFKQAVYDCAWEKVTCKKEGETKEEYANRWAEHFLLMVRDWADDYIDFTIQQKLRNSFEKGKTKTDIIEKQAEQKPTWSEEDEKILNSLINSLARIGASTRTNSTGINYTFSKEIEWLKSVKDRVQPQPKWSDENENMRNRIIGSLDALKFYVERNDKFDDERVKSNLKELEDEIKWLQDIVPQSKQELSEDVAYECVDLGLPSGTLWKPFNEDGYYTFDKAMEKFSDNLPTREQWEELKEMCRWEWKDNGYDVTGPNGNTIFLPAAGFRRGSMYSIGMSGSYWSSTTYFIENNAYLMEFYDKNIYVSGINRSFGLSVRLVRKKKGE